MPTGLALDRAALRERIEVLYMAATGDREPSGALKWYATECGLNRHNVAKWFLEGESQTTPSRQSLRQLWQLGELVEARKGHAAIRAARIRRRKLLVRVLR